MKMSGNTVLITGGSSGIGLGFAGALHQLGNRVIICGRRPERLEAVRKEYPDIITRIVDVADAADREALVAWLLREHPEVNVLINNAGVQLLADLTQPVRLERIYQELDTNFVAPLHLTSLLVPHLKEKERAAVINISSGLAFVPLSFMPVYCSTKAAIHSLTLSLRHQLRETAVQVFEIAPPAVDTDLGSDRRQDKSQTHGGMPVAEFIREAMGALENDILEAPIGTAKISRDKREAIFEERNQLWGGREEKRN